MVLTDIGLLSTDSAGNFKKPSLSSTKARTRGALAPGDRGANLKSPLTPWDGSYLGCGKHSVLVEAEHGICDDVVIGQKTAAHDLGRWEAGGRERRGKRSC